MATPPIWPISDAIVKDVKELVRFLDALRTLAMSGGGGGGAPVDALYLTLAFNATLTNERLFTPDYRLNATDLGANNSYLLFVVSPVATKSANFTVGGGDFVLFCDATGGSFTATLPAANARGAGFSVHVRIGRIDAVAANTVTIARAGADTIDGGTTFILGALQTADLESDGVSIWKVF